MVPFSWRLGLSRTAERRPRRARLSRDLVDRLSKADAGVTSVIVSGRPRRCETLATRYGAPVKKALHGGAVLEVDRRAARRAQPGRRRRPPVGRRAGLPDDGGDDRRRSAPTRCGPGVERHARASPAAASAWRSSTPASRTHRALRGRVVVTVDFTGDRGRATATTTATARTSPGIIAGGDDDGYPGMAPGATLVNLRVLGADGSGETATSSTAIDWAIAAPRRSYNIRVINLSLGHPVFESYRDDPLCQAVAARGRRGHPGGGGGGQLRQDRRTAGRSSAASSRRATRRRR